ncbi:uncharacterized protein [Drosophila tropicalis]|uniref:uncharacterized protein n=1 Tax=Drosophila tropicalis TaxID=46794 RepID=UPI0035AC013F
MIFRCFRGKCQHYHFQSRNILTFGKQLKKIISVFCSLCAVLCLFVEYKILRLEGSDDSLAQIEDVGHNISQSYFVDTPGCRMPYFKIIDNNVDQFMFKPKPYSCPKSLIKASDDTPGELHLNMQPNELLSYYNVSDITKISCKYMEIRRETDSTNEFLPQVPFKLEEIMRLPSNLEFIQVECYDAAAHRIYVDYHFFGVDKNESKVTARAGKNYETMRLNESDPIRKTDQQEGLSIMILGIDSVSHLNFLRQMPKTSTYIKKHLPHVEFWGFNKVGDNTFPNLVALLSGLDQRELEISCVNLSERIFDRCSFIWKRFKQVGYKTAFAEDVARLANFNSFFAGFNNTPTDYYFRPIMLEMEETIANNLVLNMNLCLGGRRTADVLLEYMRKLIPMYIKKQFFSFFWTVTLSHDSFNNPALLDGQMASQLSILKESGVLNRTLVLLMSDHGLRWGAFRKTYQGIMEERQPLLIALYPDWLPERYPEAVANLQLNSKRLTTPFDLHATMLDLLDIRNLEKDQLQRRADALMNDPLKLPRGISLFLPVPVERTCEQATIASHWCTCHQRKELPTIDGRVQRAARFLVRLINERLKSHSQCRTLYLNSILKAFIAAPDRQVLKESENDYAVDILVRLQTKPGLGIFEATVRMSGFTSVLTGTISRINLYGRQSHCVNDSTLKLFCYCSW